MPYLFNRGLSEQVEAFVSEECVTHGTNYSLIASKHASSVHFELLINMDVPADFSLEFEIKRLLGFDEEELTQGDPKEDNESNDASGRFKCSTCLKEFTYKASYRKHVAGAHQGMKKNEKIKCLV